MLSDTVRAQVKATAPVLQVHGETLTRHFYQRLFKGSPHLRQLFNQGHQHNGQQQQALAMAVAAYAQHIDDPSVLMPVLERVAHKHVSLGIRREHYDVVGFHLLASIREVLGEAATDQLVDAWAQAYGQLVEVLAGLEASMYASAVAREGGWTGWRAFRVVGKVPESAEITSFYLSPADGGPVPDYLPGQYLSVRVFVPELGIMQPRQYSLSDAPGTGRLRISVKRESGASGRPAGQVSNLLHDRYDEGDILDVAPPQGEFTLDVEGTNPIVLISGGVGLTPMMSMLNTVAARRDGRQVRFIHGCREGSVHAMREHLSSLTGRLPNVRSKVFYERVGPADRQGVDYHHAGRIDLHAIRDDVLLDDADYYLCGPVPFMQAQRQALRDLGVAPERIHAEVFGTGGMDA